MSSVSRNFLKNLLAMDCPEGLPSILAGIAYAGSMRGNAMAAMALCGALLAGCSKKEAAEAGLTVVRLPGGQEIRAEVMTAPADLMRGMMFRESLAPDRGMLFVHTQPGRYPYWMYQCLIPLDIIWMDASKRIVEISAETPPCKAEAASCPTYGGNHDAQFVLELAGGMARKYGLQPGMAVAF
jgi:uncharacterized membrane protein (UPF0127 family)